QLDLAIYPPAHAEAARILRRPFPGVAFGKLKLDFPRTERASIVLGRLTRVSRARRVATLSDPDWLAVVDVVDGGLRFVPVGGSGERLAEGIMQSLELMAKARRRSVGPRTAALFRALEAPDFRAFFAGAGVPRARREVRTGYLLSIFRENAGGSPARGLEVG